MICKYCGSIMILDDVDDNDYFFGGSKDKYYYCEKCDSTCCETISQTKESFVSWSEKE